MADHNTTPEEKEVLHSVEAENNILANSTMIPNIIDDMDLSPYEIRLYFRFMRRVNQNRDGSTKGSAYDSTSALAKDCKMSTGQVAKSKKILESAGLIDIKRISGKHGEFGRHHIIIVEIWEANRVFYSDRFSITVLNGPDAGTIKHGKDARKFLRDNPGMRSQIPEFIRSCRSPKN